MNYTGVAGEALARIPRHLRDLRTLCERFWDQRVLDGVKLPNHLVIPPLTWGTYQKHGTGTKTDPAWLDWRVTYASVLNAMLPVSEKQPSAIDEIVLAKEKQDG